MSESRAHPATVADDLAAPPWKIWLAGLLALSVAMGVGRFAFTPLLPLMMRDGLVDHAGGAQLAAANYLGYLVGALTARAAGKDPLRLLRRTLPLVAASTAAIALVHGLPAWSALRFAAGVFSAWVLVGTSSWALRELALRGAPRLGSRVFAGVGLGIACAGAWVWFLGTRSSPVLWLQLGGGAALTTSIVWWLTRDLGSASGSAQPGTAGDGKPAKTWPLVFCYGSFGFGYIVPATYLPVMARELVDDPAVFGLAWPLFGLAAAASTQVASRWLAAWPQRRVWALTQTAMGLGTALPLFSRSLAAVVLSALLVGGSFLVATMAGLQLARDSSQAQGTALMARMTAAFAAGQIAGPLLVWLLESGGLPGQAALSATTVMASCLLGATAAWLWRGSRSH